jgi:hypothetical protein
MYTVIGTYPDGREAKLEYQTLDEAMQKIRDLAEADEIDDEPMFVRYALQTPTSSSAAPPAPPSSGGTFQLRLVE